MCDVNIFLTFTSPNMVLLWQLFYQKRLMIMPFSNVLRRLFQKPPCALILMFTFLLLSLDRYLCWWTISPWRHHSLSSQCVSKSLSFGNNIQLLFLLEYKWDLDYIQLTKWSLFFFTTHVIYKRVQLTKKCQRERYITTFGPAEKDLQINSSPFHKNS
jgi:hypothetical protein